MPTERSPIRVNSKVKDMSHEKRVKDNGSFERSRASKSKRDAKYVSDVMGSKINGEGERTNNLDSVPRVQSSYQHDERRTAARDGRHSGSRLTSERGWWKDPKGEERAVAISDAKEREGKSRVRDVDNHDRYSESKSDAHPPTKKRRPFRETKEKLPSESENVEKNSNPEPIRVSQLGNSSLSGRYEERPRDHRPLERNEQDRGYARDKSFSNRGRGRIESTGFQARDRFNGVNHDGKFRGRGRNGNTQGYWSKGARVEKWKHDLFVEANRSPSPKKEEDPVAKVEALLSL